MARQTPPASLRRRLTPRAIAQLLLGLALGLGAWLAVAGRVDLDQVWAGLRRAHPAWVGLAGASVLLTTAAKVLRWRTLFPGPRMPSCRALTGGLLVGQVANALLPMRAGDLMRAYWARAGGGTGLATALGTVAAEKVFDVLLLLLCAGLAALLAPLPPWLAGSLVALAVAGLLVLGLAVALPPARIGVWIARLLPLPWALDRRLGDAVARGLAGLAGLRRPRRALKAMAWSIVIWGLGAATNYLLFPAFSWSLPAGAAVFLLVLLYVGVAPPTSPVRVGVFHALVVLGLETFGVERPGGLAYATLLHLVVYLPQIVGGAVALGLGLGLGSGRRGEERR